MSTSSEIDRVIKGFYCTTIQERGRSSQQNCSLKSSSTYELIESWSCLYEPFNTLRPRRNEQHFADDIFKRIFFNENVWISIKISLKFVPKGSINNIPALVQIMAWCRPGDKPLSEPMMVSLPTHICVTRPQWVNWFANFSDSGLHRRIQAYCLFGPYEKKNLIVILIII